MYLYAERLFRLAEREQEELNIIRRSIEVLITWRTRNCPNLLEVVGIQFSASPVTVRFSAIGADNKEILF